MRCRISPGYRFTLIFFCLAAVLGIGFRGVHAQKALEKSQEPTLSTEVNDILGRMRMT